MNELSERQKFILALVVHEYARTAAPVGSRFLVEQYRLEMSPATVRNELAALTDAHVIECLEQWDIQLCTFADL